MEEQSKARLFPCPYHTLTCDIFNCRKRSMWYVGRPDATISNTFKLCDDCAKAILNHPPIELVDGGNELVARLEAEFEVKKLEEVAKARAYIKYQYDAQLEIEKKKLADKLPKKEEIVIEAEPVELSGREKAESLVDYRCLDCDQTFANGRALSNHMRRHDIKKEG